MAWSDVIANKHNAQGTFYVDSKIGPMVAIYHRENLEHIIDECERFAEEEAKAKKDSRLHQGQKTIADIHELLLSVKHEHWKTGLIIEWDFSERVKKGLDKLGFRVLRNYPMLNQLHEIIERHLNAHNEFQE